MSKVIVSAQKSIPLPKWSQLKYGVKLGSQIPAKKAQSYGEFLQELADMHGGRLNAETVVEAAKSPKSPIHREFEWNDGAAAWAYREEQARHLIRSIVIIRDSEPEVRAFHCVKFVEDEMERSFYLPLNQVLTNRELLEQVLEEALSYLEWFKKKFECLKELGKIHQAIDVVLTEHKR